MNIFLLLAMFCQVALGGELDQAVTVTKGERAPFTGTLLSPEAAAKLLTNSDEELQRCKAESKYLLDKQLSEQKLKYDLLKADLTACTYLNEQNKILYNEQIDFLERQAVSPSWEKPAWFAGGIITGIAIVITSAYALEKIGD